MNGYVQGHVTFLNFGQSNDDVSQTVQDRDIVLIGNHMLLIEWHQYIIPMVFNDVGGHFSCLKHF